MRILFVIRSLNLGGAERQCAGLAMSLRTRGHDVSVVSLASGGVLESELKGCDVSILACGHRGPRDLIRSGMRLRKIVMQCAPDVIYSFMSVSNILCAICLPRALRERLVWGVRASWVDHPGYGAISRIVPRIERLLAHSPRQIICNSQAGANYHARLGYPESRIHVVENAIDITSFDYSVLKRKEVRDRLGVSDDTRIVVLVARIDLIKGHDMLLAAAARIVADRQDVCFWCIGGGDAGLAIELRNRTKALGLEAHVSWHGEVRETAALVALLCAADLAVSASMAEGFPNAVAECLACGLRVVGTDAGDTRRIIGDSGECVSIGDEVTLALAILRQLEQGTLRERVRADFLVRFEPGFLLERHESLLLAVARQTLVQSEGSVAR